MPISMIINRAGLAPSLNPRSESSSEPICAVLNIEQQGTKKIPGRGPKTTSRQLRLFIGGPPREEGVRAGCLGHRVSTTLRLSMANNVQVFAIWVTKSLDSKSVEVA